MTLFYDFSKTKLKSNNILRVRLVCPTYRCLVVLLTFICLYFQLGGLHDRHLVGMLLVLVLWDLLYLSVWQSISPLTTEIKELVVSLGILIESHFFFQVIFLKSHRLMAPLAMAMV